jgi:hypothetical protein
MKASILLLALCFSSSGAVQAQGLIGAPQEGADKVANRLELERAKRFHDGLSNQQLRIEYGAMVWKLADTYESLNQWQNALAAYNTLADLKLPPNAIANCNTCVMRAGKEILKIDQDRLHNKVWAVESVDHMKFDHRKRLPTPTWTPQRQQEYEKLQRDEPLAESLIVPGPQIFGR